jgi:hypothetical protein
LPIKVERRDGTTRHEYVVNVSASGLCLHAKQPLPVGEELRVSLRLPSDAHEICAVAKVVWSSHREDGLELPRCWETGLFLVEVAECDVERLAWFVSAQVDRR